MQGKFGQTEPRSQISPNFNEIFAKDSQIN